MRSEVFHIRNREICCEVYESELKLDGHDKEPITVLTFALGSFSIDALMEMGGHLWVEVARRYLNLKKAFSEKSSAEVIGRISFECDRVRVEYEFSKLTKSVLLNLIQVAPFLKQYPESEEMRISRDGPILVRFRNSDFEATAATPADSSFFKLPLLINGLRRGWGAIWPGEADPWIRKPASGKNMKIKVACGRDSLTLSLPGQIPATVESLLNCVQKLHPQLYAAWCDEHNLLRESLPVFVNGEHVRYRQGLQTELKDGDDVYIIPLIAGG